MKKSLKIVIIAILVIVLILAVIGLKKDSTYKKILDIRDNAIKQVSNINNVKITFNPKGVEDENKKAKVVIKDGIQCTTDDRKLNEENESEYNVLNTKEKKETRVESHYNDKKIYINNNTDTNLYTTELLYTLVIPQFSLIDNYKIEEDRINEINCYKININDKDSEVNEYTYWISKDNGLLIKQEIQYKVNGENHNEQCSYDYEFDSVTDYDVREVNLDEYSDYKKIINY